MTEEECLHQWEFLQTLWEVDKPMGTTATFFNSEEYAYFTCHQCKTVEKRKVLTFANHIKKESK
jgi:hypothetical protein